MEGCCSRFSLRLFEIGTPLWRNGLVPPRVVEEEGVLRVVVVVRGKVELSILSSRTKLVDSKPKQYT
jgi:hypothetical protein